MAILDWRTDVQNPPGPPAGHRVAAADAVAALQTAGWAVLQSTAVGTYSYWRSRESELASHLPHALPPAECPVLSLSVHKIPHWLWPLDIPAVRLSSRCTLLAQHSWRRCRSGVWSPSPRRRDRGLLRVTPLRFYFGPGLDIGPCFGGCGNGRFSGWPAFLRCAQFSPRGRIGIPRTFPQNTPYSVYA